MLEVKDIDVYYGASQALKSVSISAEAGKVTSIMEETAWVKPPFSTLSLDELPRATVKYSGREKIFPSFNPTAELTKVSLMCHRDDRYFRY